MLRFLLSLSEHFYHRVSEKSKGSAYSSIRWWQIYVETLLQSTEHKVDSTENYRVQSTKYRVQGTEYRIQRTEYRGQSTEYRETPMSHINISDII
jgi:hypothetical protein